MRKSILILSAGAAFMLSLFLFSAACHRAKTEDTAYATDQANAEQTFDDVETIGYEAASTPNGGTMSYKSTGGGGCAHVTHSGDSTIIDFGQADCVCHDGRRRRGRIIEICTAPYTQAGSVSTLTFDNYYQDDNKVTGTKVVTNMGNNAQGQPYYDISVKGAVTLTSSGGTITANWTRMRTWTAGYNTPNDPTDDVFSVTGGGTLTEASGRVVTMSITAPLIIANGCQWVEAGSVTFSVASGQYRVLNYGSTPNCDNQATLTLGNGTVHNITLP